MDNNTTEPPKKARVAVIGAGWWSQGWHLPHLSRNTDTVTLVGIVDTNPSPQSTLNPNLESLEILGKKYNCPTYGSVQELLLAQQQTKGDVDNPTGKFLSLDGVIICTPHATHYDLAQEIFINNAIHNQNTHILLEKPMTTNVHQAQKLHDLVLSGGKDDNVGTFRINHSANFRTQCQMARNLIQTQKAIGDIQHISAFFGSPLSWIFDDPAQKNWNEPTKTMIGNGFAWGQSSHILAWIYQVTGKLCNPKRVYCSMTHSAKTGADVSHAATIDCYSSSLTDDENNNTNTTNGKQRKKITLSLSGTSLLPGNAHSDPPVAKRIQIQIYGSKGALLYQGNDQNCQSGTLELRKEDGSIETFCTELGFQFEDLDTEGKGPESLQSFLRACCKPETNETADAVEKGGNKNKEEEEEDYLGASSEIGLKSVQTIDAMYRSNKSGKPEEVAYYCH